MTNQANAELASLVRTLIGSAFQIEEAVRQPYHIELTVSRQDKLGVRIPYLFALCDEQRFTDDQIAELQAEASNRARVLVLVSPHEQPSSVSLNELFNRLGGEIPSWRALAPDYFDRLRALGENRLPDGMEGEAWRLFEEAVNDGLEYIFGRRVTRLGGGKRGARFPDSVAPTPDGGILLVDSKSARGGFDCTADNLRPIHEYALQQKSSQQGTGALSGCLIVSSSFLQDNQRLRDIADEFLADLGVPLAFLTTAGLSSIVSSIQPNSTLRNALRWKRTFCIPGAIDPTSIERELQVVQTIRT